MLAIRKYFFVLVVIMMGAMTMRTLFYSLRRQHVLKWVAHHHRSSVPTRFTSISSLKTTSRTVIDLSDVSSAQSTRQPTGQVSGNYTSSSSAFSTPEPRTTSRNSAENTPAHNQPPTPDQRKVLCMSFSGRLGNQMFQYAATVGLAAKLGRVPVFSNTGLLDATFQKPVSTLSGLKDSQERCRKAPQQKEDACCRFSEVLLKLDPNKDYRVSQYLQSWKYFEGMNRQVKELCRFKDSLMREVNRTIQEMRLKYNRTLIGVHMRRGDYLISKHVKMGYRTPPNTYYLKAMDYLRKRFGKVTFLVSIDDEKWFRHSVTSASDVVLLKRNSSKRDMATLSSLDHIITSVGTYSWWTGYLNAGVVIYWKDFIAPGTVIGNQFSPNGSTYIFPGWIPL